MQYDPLAPKVEFTLNNAFDFKFQVKCHESKLHLLDGNSNDVG